MSFGYNRPLGDSGCIVVAQMHTPRGYLFWSGSCAASDNQCRRSGGR